MPGIDSSPVATSVSVERYSDWRALQGLASSWTELCKAQTVPSYFVTWHWAATWWQAYGNDHDLFVLICRNSNNEVIGIAPLYRKLAASGTFKIRTLCWIGDGTDDADGFSPLVRQGEEQRAISAMFDRLLRLGDEWDLMELNSMPSASNVVALWRSEAITRRWLVKESASPQRLVSLADSFDLYLESLSRKTRQALKRRMRNLEESFSVAWRRCESVAEIQSGFETLVALHQKNWKAKGKEGKFTATSRLDFYRKMALLAGAAGNLDLCILELDGVPAAARLAFRSNGTRHAVFAAMDPAFRRYGVGGVAEALSIKDSIDRGDRFYDFLAGDENYKKEMGAELASYTNLAIARPRTRVAIQLAAGRSADSGKRWLRNRFPETYKTIKNAKTRLLG